MQISRRQHGFTLIEVMIVVAIIGILAAIIMPGIRDYAIRAKMSEVMLAFQNCRQAISEGYQVMEASPGPDNWGCEDSTKSPYILTVNTTGTGIIKISVQGFNDLRIDTHDITMAPVDFQGNFGTVGETRIAQWRCGAPRDGTTMRPNYLPANCKG